MRKIQKIALIKGIKMIKHAFIFYITLSIFGIQYCLAQKSNQVHNVKIYFIPINKFTRISIDSSNIKSYNDLEFTIRNPNYFVEKLHNLISSKKPLNDVKFGNDYVRILYSIKYRNGIVENIFVDASRSLLWQNKVYYVDEDLLDFLLTPLTIKQKEEFGIHTVR